MDSTITSGNDVPLLKVDLLLLVIKLLSSSSSSSSSPSRITSKMEGSFCSILSITKLSSWDSCGTAFCMSRRVTTSLALALESESMIGFHDNDDDPDDGKDDETASSFNISLIDDVSSVTEEGDTCTCTASILVISFSISCIFCE